MRRVLLILIVAAAVSSVHGQSYSTEDAAAVSQSYTLEGKKDYDGAIAQLKGRGEKPLDYFFQLRLGWLYYLKGAYTMAASYYERASALRPQATEALTGIMNSYYYAKDYKHVASAAQQALKDNPGDYYGNLYMIVTLMASQNYAGAQMQAEEALKLYPIDYKINLNLAYIYINQGRKDDARAIANLMTTVYGNNDDTKALWKAVK